jgi:transposase
LAVSVDAVIPGVIRRPLGMNAYSTDLRERVVAAGDAGDATREQIATAAVRLGGVPEPAGMAFDGATDTEYFETYVERCPAPTLRPGDIVVMDDPARHETAEVARRIEAAGARVRYLPASSPDLNPIERLFSKLKAWLRSAAARTVEGLIAAMGDAWRAVRPGDILGWFRHSGYKPSPSSDTLNKKPL